MRGARADVEIEPGPACEKCGASGFCNWTGKRSRLLLACNDVGAEAGEMVLVETAEGTRPRSAGLVFGVLGGAMAAGIVLGTLVRGDIGAAVLGGVGLVAGFGVLKLINRRVERSGRGLPVIVRRLAPGEAETCRSAEPAAAD